MNQALSTEQLRSLTPLNLLSSQQCQVLGEQLVPQPLLRGQLLFREGDQARRTFFLLSGELLLENSAGEQSRLVAGSEASCHPVAHELPRRYSATAATEVSYLELDSTQLDQLLNWRLGLHDLLLQLDGEDQDSSWIRTLLDNPLFSKVPVANIQAMCERLQALELKAGDVVLSEGEHGDCCYFLRSGLALVTRGSGAEEKRLAELEPGACFGEEALLADSPRNASVQMLEDGVVLRLNRQDFFALLRAPVVDEVSLGEAIRLLGDGAQWLDVRLQVEYERAHAAQSLHMPLQLLRFKARLLDPKRLYLCYCDSGKRSANAVFLLSQLGFKAVALRDGLDALPAIQRGGLLCEDGPGYLLRSGGRIERSG
jgi:CRP-like cAMP-binding protein